MEIKKIITQNTNNNLYTLEIDKNWWAKKYDTEISNGSIKCSYDFKYSWYQLNNEYINCRKDISDIKWEAFIVLNSKNWKDWELQHTIETKYEEYI